MIEENPSDLPIVSAFSQLVDNPTILASLERSGFQIPTSVQAASIPAALKGTDVIIQAKTGSGKTLAYVIPLIDKLLKSLNENNPLHTQGLIIVPTRELALQVVKVINSISDIFRPACLIGGVDQNTQSAELSSDPRIVVGTPGRILDLLRQKILKLNRCRFFALDEADEMLSMGFIEDVRTILSRLPDRRQGLFISATITPRVDMLAHSFLTRPQNITFEIESADKPPIEHLYCEIAGDLMAKPSALCDLIETIRPLSAIIFCNTKSDTQLVEALLRRRGFDARRINSDLSQSQRDRIMKKIHAQELQFLVATDIAARGLDIEQLDLVINYSIHEQPETYVHRTGRTGRAGRRGKAISLVGPRDFGAFHFLTKVLDLEFNKLPLPSDTEVADARLTHLYEMIRQGEIELNERDLVVSGQLLKETGGITEPSEDLQQIIAKLCRLTIEHYINLEAKSLDEELDAHPATVEGKGRYESGDDYEHSANRKRRDHERGGRDRERERERSGRSRQKDRRNKQSDHHQEHRESNTRENEVREHAVNENKERTTHRPQDFAPEVRVYVGQGSHHGITPEIFAELAEEFAELNTSDIRNITIREHYGFVDLLEPKAKLLIANLNGIEYNQQPLPLEIAAVLSQEQRPRRERGNNRREGDHRESNRREHSRRDNRRGHRHRGER